LKPIEERLLQDAADYIDRWVGYRQRSQRIPGVAIAVGHRGRLVLSRAYGHADLERDVRLTTGHVFRIASHSKTFTATAVMQLVEQGRVRLDDEARDHVSWLPEEGDVGRVTIRQMLSHAAGVIRDGEDGGFWVLERDFPDADELRAAITGTAPVFPENRQFKYSNFGYALLGQVVEAASGMPYNDYVRRSIVQPLGLRDTGPELDDHARARLATGYTGDHYGLERLPLDHADTRAMSAATGFYSTAEDLCRYGTAHFLGSDELLTDRSRREMQREHWKVEGGEHYGLGFGIYTVGERRVIGHGGGFPGFITSTRIDPKDQLVVVALTNASDGPAAELVNGMLHIVNRAMEAAAEPADQPEVDRDRFAGRYWTLGGAADVVRFGADLVAVDPELPNPFEPAVELKVEGPDLLRITKAPGYGSPGEPVRFTFDDAGRVTHVQWAAIGMVPWEAFEGTVLASVRATRRAPRRTASPAS
jgi:CubicO group peptidase (beta-lactamase class C family)